MRGWHLLATCAVAAVALLWLRSAATHGTTERAAPAQQAAPTELPAAGDAAEEPPDADVAKEDRAEGDGTVVVPVVVPPASPGRFVLRKPGEDAAIAWSREVNLELTDAERAAVDRHLNRFVRGSVPVPGTETSASVDAKVLPLPRAAPEEAEQRRREQLELLQQREALVLLDNIGKGLAWLALHQGEDGKISNVSAAARCKELGHKPVCADTGGRGSDEWAATAATGLSILALLDFRDQDKQGVFEPTLARAVHWLRRTQRENGSFPGREFYATAISALALSQAATASGSDELREAARRGLAYLATQRGPRGGYRYRTGEDGDLSVTAWVAQAVEAARHAKVEIPAGMDEGIRSFLDAVWIREHRFAYVTTQGERQTLDPAGILVGLIEWEVPCPDGAWVCSDDGVLGTWRDWLKQAPPKGGIYTLYYAVRVAIRLEPSMPEAWRDTVLKLAARQKPAGPGAGSFKDTLAAGEVVETALSVLTLEHALYKR